MQLGYQFNKDTLALVLLEVNGLDWRWLRRFFASVLRVIYRKDARKSHEY
jgi:hypothetical protein